MIIKNAFCEHYHFGKLYFFRLTTCSSKLLESPGSLVHNAFNFWRLPGTFGLRGIF